MNVAIIGSGSWATALAKIIMHNVPDINWHIRRQEVIDEFVEIRRNPNHLEWAYFDWMEWEIGMVDMAVPLSPDELIKKRTKFSVRLKSWV